MFVYVAVKIGESRTYHSRFSGQDTEIVWLWTDVVYQGRLGYFCLSPPVGERCPRRG